MYFIGQSTIMAQLQILLPRLYQSKKGANILLRGPSGWGKTRMAYLICNYLASRDFQFSIGNKEPFNKNLWVHLIDEVHLVKEPEYLYPLMDSGNYVFVLTTNDVEILPEALSNRCYEYIFAPYTVEELRIITQDALWSKMDTECLDLIIDSGGRNPRIIIKLVDRINLYQAERGIIPDRDKLVTVLKAYLGIINGLDIECQRYIEVLREAGGRAALDTLSVMLHINKDSIRYNIEPVLLQKRLIQITSKGRILLDAQ